MAKTWVVLLGLLAACGSKEKPSKTPGVTRVPTVSVASVVIAAPANPPPVLILLDAKKNLHAAKIASWDLLSTKDPLVGAQRTTISAAAAILGEGRAMGHPPDRIYESFKNTGGVEVDLAALEGGRNDTGDYDPPPPEEEDKPDDGEEESGGTGTAMALDEGKMGKADSDRAEGQYKMRKEQEDPVLAAAEAKQKALEAAREPLHNVAGSRETLGPPRTAFDYATPLATGVTEWVAADQLEQPPYAVLLAAPDVKASDFIVVVNQLHPRVAVAHAGKVRPLRLETMPERDWADEPRQWIELTLGPTDMMFEAVPEKPVPLSGPFDQAAFTAALDTARKSRELDPLTRVDVLVDPNVDVQRLINVLVALDQAGVVMIGLGERPGTESREAALRGHRRPDLRLGMPNAQGDLDKAIIRRYIKRQRDKIFGCYESWLKTNAPLSGTVQAQFFITPNGDVATSSAAGLNWYVADCVANVIKAIEFPKPKGGGGVQVNYPFTFSY